MNLSYQISNTNMEQFHEDWTKYKHALLLHNGPQRMGIKT